MPERVAVTIGIPFLNARTTLPDAVRSVFAQTYADWELMLVDDGSSDGSLEIARTIRDPRVRLLSDGVRRGLVYRLNQIASLAQGRYLARMDADDLMHPRRIERQAHFLDENPKVDVVDTATYTVDSALTPLGIRGDRPLQCAPQAVLLRGLFVHPTVMGRTAWFRRHPYDPAYVRAEDHELWCRTCATTQFARLREPLFFYREDPAGNLRNYLQSAATVRCVLRAYGPALVGRGRTLVAVMQSYLRSLMYYGYTKLGRQGRLIKKRNRPLEPAEAQAARGILADIRRVAVPGLQNAPEPEEVLA
jgi:glycosyltransferase involved in cell wall biosynthesis